MADRRSRRARLQAPPKAALLGAAEQTQVDREHEPRYESWQAEGWAYYDSLGELRSGVTWHGNVLSRARLVAARRAERPGDEPTVLDPDEVLEELERLGEGDNLPDGPLPGRELTSAEGDQVAVELVAQVADGMGGQSELLRAAAVHLDVPGEGWFVAQTDDELTSWRFYSADELRRKRVDGVDVYEVEVGEGEWRSLGPDILPTRVYRPHQRRHWKADSSVRAALPILRELDLLNRHLLASAQSRLAANGLYWIPNEIDFPSKPEYADQPDPFTAEFYDIGSTAIRTPGSALAALPMVGRAAGDRIAQIRLDTFATPFEEQLIQLREQTIRRLAIAMDWPPEVLLGTADVNHWGAWLIHDEALQVVVMPFLELICWALTLGYLWPALEAAGVAERQSYVVWYDVSELVVRPDRSGQTLEAYVLDIVSAAAVLRELGLDEVDAPGFDELRLKQLARLLTNPLLAASAAESLGLFNSVLAPAGGTGPPPAPAPGATEPAPADSQETSGAPSTRDNPPPPTQGNGSAPAPVPR